MRGVFSRISDFYRKERDRLTIFTALLLVGGLSFESGFLFGGTVASAPLLIEKPAPAISASESAEKRGETANDARKVGDIASNVQTSEKCAFVGSRNSDLYHLPTCASAKRIKPENVVCFVSAEDAAARGYKPGCLK